MHRHDAIPNAQPPTRQTQTLAHATSEAVPCYNTPPDSALPRHARGETPSSALNTREK